MKRLDKRSEEINLAMEDYRGLKLNDGMTQDERDEEYWKFRRRQDEIIFLMTREGSSHDLNYVLDLVYKEFDGVIYEAYKTKIIRKGRRDVYILTSDNLIFKDTYNTVLKREQDLYANKGE